MVITLNLDIPKKAQQEILKNITILVDTREKKNDHILSYFDAKGIKYIKSKLDFGDYSVMLPESEFWPKQPDFAFNFVVERKNSLEELSGNFAEGRTRFETELIGIKDEKINTFLVIEQADLADIYTNNYNTSYNVNAFLGSFWSY